MIDSICTNLLTWYQQAKRDLPWRHDTDPYRIWVLEVMSQQTQMATVEPYYHHFFTKFPTLADLAAAPLSQVLKAWEGLGYYARARHLHQAALTMMSQHGGQVPSTYSDLHKLPGFGDYTAGAVASIAFGVVVPAIDGNVKRVLARLFAIQSDLTRREGANQLLSFATQLVQRSSQLRPEPKIAGEWNQAMIELGALICLPQTPQCGECPVQAYCQAYQRDLVAELPWRKGKKTLPHYNVTAAVIQSGDKLLIAQRPLKGMLGGLWEFPGGKQEVGETLSDCLKREIQEELGVEIEVGELLTVIKHSYTHFKITLHAFMAQLLPNQQPRPLGVADWGWVTQAELANYAFPRTDSQIIEKLGIKN